MIYIMITCAQSLKVIISQNQKLGLPCTTSILNNWHFTKYYTCIIVKTREKLDTEFIWIISLVLLISYTFVDIYDCFSE